MDRNRLISRVKIKMEEVSPHDYGDISPVGLVDETLNEAGKRMQLEVPLHLLIPTDFTPLTVPTGTVNLPNDFLRLASFQMACWERPVTYAISKEHPLYALQKNDYTMGGISKPVVVVYRTDSGKVLEYYSVPSGTVHNIDHALYIKDVEAEDLDNSLEDLLTWKCAAMVFEIMQEFEQAAIMNKAFNEYIVNYKY